MKARMALTLYGRVKFSKCVLDAAGEERRFSKTNAKVAIDDQDLDYAQHC
jgi:hypothetical protein